MGSRLARSPRYAPRVWGVVVMLLAVVLVLTASILLTGILHHANPGHRPFTAALEVKLPATTEAPRTYPRVVPTAKDLRDHGWAMVASPILGHQLLDPYFGAAEANSARLGKNASRQELLTEFGAAELASRLLQPWQAPPSARSGARAYTLAGDGSDAGQVVAVVLETGRFSYLCLLDAADLGPVNMTVGDLENITAAEVGPTNESDPDLGIPDGSRTQYAFRAGGSYYVVALHRRPPAGRRAL